MQSYSVEAVLGVKGAKEFTRSFERASSSVGKLEKMAGGLKSVGRKMTTSITLPVVAMGTAIATTGAKFDDQLSTVQAVTRSEEHTSELQSRGHLVCRLLLEKKHKPRGTHNAEGK